MNTIDERIDEVRPFATIIAARQRYAFPIQEEDGAYPVITTIPDEPLSRCIQRIGNTYDAINLVVVSGHQVKTCVLRLSTNIQTDENTIVLPQNSSYTIGQYIQDSQDLGTFLPVHTMNGITMTTDSPLKTLLPA